MSGLSFVSESAIEERRRQRQEEYDKNRTEDMPLEAPEEPYDSRTLYERLKEQKDIKDEEFEESRKLKNLIKTLDSDEVTFLEMVDNTKMQLESQRLLEEHKTLEEFKRAMNHVDHEEQEKRLNDMKKTMFANSFVQNEANSSKCPKKSTQSALLANVVRKRTQSDSNDDKTPKKSRSDSTTESTEDSKTSETSPEVSNIASVKCIGVLPGLGHYANSDDSDSDNSSSSDVERVGFKLIVRNKRQPSAPAVKSPQNQ